MEQQNYNIDKNTANDLLNNVLDSCNIPPSSKSIEKIMLKRSIEVKPIIFFKYISIILLLFCICTPLLFRPDPTFSLVTKSKNVVVSSHNLYEGFFVMSLSGEADYKNIYAKKDDGAIIFPDTSDSSTGVVIFPYNGDSLNIYIPTMSGECIQAVLHEKK